ncbi:hypothetical protein QN326_07300 [Candidatus Phytoplasma asteris]|uniref:Uncharacterized protein n=1 Tax=Candidatus Phytoplasma asteris TaxID=85620 RepID=A0ABZ3CFJ8_9MOLU
MKNIYNPKANPKAKCFLMQHLHILKGKTKGKSMQEKKKE